MHVQTATQESGHSSASSTSGSALSPPERASTYFNIHITNRELSPRNQLDPEDPARTAVTATAAPPAGDDILKVEIPRWKSKLTTDRADRVHVPVGVDSVGNSPLDNEPVRLSMWNRKDGRGGHGGSMGALVLGKDRDNGSKKRYTVFQIYMHFQSGTVRMSEKRYSHFRELHKTLRRKYVTVGKLYFPPKKFFMSLSLRVIEQRREAIETYMNAVLTLRPRPIEVVQFLSSGSSSVDDEDEDGNSTGGPAHGVDMVTTPKHVQSASTAFGTSSRLSGSNSITPTDIQNFDREFTKELPDHGFLQQDKRLSVSPKNEFQGFSYMRTVEPASWSRESSSKREKRRSGQQSEQRTSEGIERKSESVTDEHRLSEAPRASHVQYKQEDAVGMEPIGVVCWKTQSTL
ncbi:unnamed protein product [Peronospora belbahrii]|uniref:PX domain-containing protein n=1 Tax=Peronospora belbahrii TaxID=622444 RepID=A0AAU9L7Q0_9STRA|nr:unnamed protein product [Peronospora belbahrii]